MLGLSQGSATTATPSRPWLDKSMPTSARVNALLNAMTLPEKVGQMDQQLVDNVTDPNSANCSVHHLLNHDRTWAPRQSRARRPAGTSASRAPNGDRNR
jgi:hypothetical protein